MPRNSTPTLSPAVALSSSLRNISMSVATVLRVSLMPTISTSDMRSSTPRSTRPVTTVPRPSMLNTSSMHIRNGLSTSRGGNGMKSSMASINAWMESSPAFSPASAALELPRTTGVFSPGNSYLVSRSRTSIFTSSSSSLSSTRSTLFR